MAGYIVGRIQTELKAPGSYNLVQLITRRGRWLLLFKVKGKITGSLKKAVIAAYKHEVS